MAAFHPFTDTARVSEGGDRAMAPGGAPAKQLPPKPPDRGSFPLDPFRECSDSKKLYVDCLKQHDMQAEACRHLAGAYLQCRMDTCAATTCTRSFVWVWAE